jgi:hypothetical protein
MSDNLQFYATVLGWPLFPCSNKTKAPITPHGFKDATADWQQIKAWSEQYPRCAWGTPTIAERGVIDIDPRHGGTETLARLEAEHGALPLTPKVRTGGDGYHHWLCFPPGTKCGRVADGIDRKADGGYVIIPPSKVELPEHEGRAYSWDVRPWEVALAEAPKWCVGSEASHAMPHGLPLTQTADPWVVQSCGDDLLSHLGSPKGERHTTLCRLVGIHLARGDSEPSILALAEAWAGRCKPPFGDWWKVVEGLIAKEKVKAEKMTNHSPPCRTRIAIEEDRSDTLAVGKEGINSQPFTEAELIPSFPGPAKNGQGEKELSTDWPTLSANAYHGLFGEMLKAVTPETEADPSGILLGWLTCFGNIIGRGAWFPVGPRHHYANLSVGIVGRSSDAKGDGWSVALCPFQQADPVWASACVANGVGSGEGLIERIADEQQYLDKSGEVKVIPGATDKRCVLRLSELSKCFKLGRRENATLSEYLREAWDGEPIHVPNRKGNALSATGYSVSVLGDITPGVVRKLLEGGTEGFDGFANRFLWCVVRSGKDLASGGNIEVLKPFLDRLKTALAFARNAGEMRRDAEADAMWCEVYGGLKRSGDSVPHTDRARPYVVRLSMIYALADCSAVVRREHLAAALAVWEYCRQSARMLFAQEPSGTLQADPLWLQVLNAICRSPGIARSELLRAFRSASAEEIGTALALLVRDGKAFATMVQPEGGGRPAECWWPILGPTGEGSAQSDTADNSPSPFAQESEAEGGIGGKEGIDSPPEGDASAECVGKERKEGKNSRQVVNSFLLEGESDKQPRCGGEWVVTREAFDHKPEGGFLASGEPDRPHWPPPSYGGVRRRDNGMFDLLPAFHHLPSPPKRQPHPDDDPTITEDFLSGLAVE